MTGPLLTIPAPSAGPTARLQLDDPATMLIIVAWLGVLAIKALPAAAGWHIDRFYPQVAVLLAAGYTTVTVAVKHWFAGVLARAQLARAVMPESSYVRQGVTVQSVTVPA